MSDMPAGSALPADSAPPLLSVRNLCKTFYSPPNRPFGELQPVVAVEDVSFDIPAGRTLGLVGESGCGKTTVSRLILRLIEPDSGAVHFAGEDVLRARGGRLRRLRRRMQIIFQDPLGSLNPRMTVGAAIAEPLSIHRVGTRRERRERVAELLRQVGLSPDHMSRYPHEFSGGQRQRIVIARALGLNPELVICDEPVSALDVSVQAQILNLLKDLQDRMSLAYLFIAHDPAVVEFMSDEILEMKAGSARGTEAKYTDFH